jgi:hypothetical protein
MRAVEVRFSKKDVGITLEALSHRQQGLVRWLAWEKARKDWIAKGGMWGFEGEPRG